MTEQGDHLEFAPRLPAAWDGLTFHLLRHGSRMRVDVDVDGLTLSVLDGDGVPVRTDGELVVAHVDEPLRIPRC
jgi:trehalose/maltose hydrolase-like predicted phosphorylase